MRTLPEVALQGITPFLAIRKRNKLACSKKSLIQKT
jgi:hypothetical protein